MILFKYFTTRLNIIIKPSLLLRSFLERGISQPRRPGLGMIDVKNISKLKTLIDFLLLIHFSYYALKTPKHNFKRKNQLFIQIIL